MSAAAGHLLTVEKLARKAVADAIRRAHAEVAAGHAGDDDRVVEAWYSQRPRSQAEVAALYDSAIARLSGTGPPNREKSAQAARPGGPPATTSGRRR